MGKVKELVVGHITSKGIFCLDCVDVLTGLVNFPIIKGSTPLECDKCGNTF